MQKETEKDKQAQREAAAALLGDPVYFQVPFYFGINIKLGIRPLLPGTMVRINKILTKLRDIETGDIYEVFEKGDNIVPIAEALATAVINDNIFKMWKYRWYRWLMLHRTESTKHLYYNYLLLLKQADPEFFFLIMELTPALKMLRKRMKAEKPSEGKPSGEHSPESKKHSN
jgi:hypothetical protein